MPASPDPPAPPSLLELPTLPELPPLPELPSLLEVHVRLTQVAAARLGPYDPRRITRRHRPAAPPADAAEAA